MIGLSRSGKYQTDFGERFDALHSKNRHRTGHFTKALAYIRENGFCYCESEYMEDIVSCAAPIKDYSKGVVATLTLVVPVQRLQHQPLLHIQKKS
ncbi:hypothetical protein EJP82_23645 [Paenibacillus anaericanus]|uniref:IclR-ED domain-containing protein n=1 Tax=Paenibacillus anaericanus TaxID=170367 RepID=A0A3S1K154_9BACL|nr:hypothetical protein EJP82_23645 [Paenibacillus anaericanus]